MQHSESPTRRALAVGCYLDESATDGGTPTAVVGGLLINKPDYLNFDAQWQNLLDDCRLRPALHIKDFGRHGRFSAMAPTQIRAILSRAITIIQEHRIYSLSATLRHEDYLQIFSEGTRKTHSPYEFCFLMAALANGKMAQFNKYQEPIAFVVDKGNPYAEHVRLAHAEMERLFKTEGFPTNIGPLTFDSDENISALQAADLVCWGARRQASGENFREGFEPIAVLINSDSGKHQTIPLDRPAMEVLERYFSDSGNVKP
jgi:hypothetical protein